MEAIKLKYQYFNGRVLTACPFRMEDRVHIGSTECDKCKANKGKGVYKETQAYVSCGKASELQNVLNQLNLDEIEIKF